MFVYPHHESSGCVTIPASQADSLRCMQGDAFHRVCRSGSLADAIVLIKSNPLLVQKHDQVRARPHAERERMGARGIKIIWERKRARERSTYTHTHSHQMHQYPLHAACCNHRLYAWKIVKFVLAEYPEAARHADSLGRLPLHLAAANEGPTHDARGMALCPDDQEELQEISNNGFEMVSLLLEVIPSAHGCPSRLDDHRCFAIEICLPTTLCFLYVCVVCM